MEATSSSRIVLLAAAAAFALLFHLAVAAEAQRTTRSVHDLLPEYGLPKGLLPSSVKSYTFSGNGEFVVELDAPCYVQFSDMVYYDKVIKGKLSYGAISDLSGIQAKKLFVWLPVTGIVADPDGKMIEFDVGFLSEKLPAAQFATVPTCKASSSSSPCHGGFRGARLRAPLDAAFAE